MTGITIKRLKPRNPLVASCRFRKAGSHERSGASRRQRAERELRRVLGDLDHRRHGI